jgi:exopolysaccharide production protein ExoZ
VTTRFELIQFLRFVAAALVVISHATQAYDLRIVGGDGTNYWYFGTFGVDIFFVISGFIMVSTTDASAPNSRAGWLFLRKRLIRVVPLYWFFTTLKLLILLVSPSASLKSFPTAENIFESYFFIPFKGEDGSFWPVLSVGWTLNFEMFFYLAFAFSVAFFSARVVGVVIVFIAVFVLQFFFLSQDVLSFYLDSILLEFVLGMVIAANRNSIVCLFKSAFGSRSAVVFIICVMFLSFVVLDGLPRGLHWGVPAALIVLVAIILEGEPRVVEVLSPFSRLGNSSYSLYLSHTFVVPATAVILAKLSFAGFSVVIILGFVFSIIFSEVVYRFFERPLLDRFGRVS